MASRDGTIHALTNKPMSAGTMRLVPTALLPGFHIALHREPRPSYMGGIPRIWNHLEPVVTVTKESMNSLPTKQDTGVISGTPLPSVHPRASISKLTACFLGVAAIHGFYRKMACISIG